MRTHYQILGVQPDASVEVIDAVAKTLSRKFHPDNQQTGDSDKFKRVREAYDVLKDPVTRRAYDVSVAASSRDAKRANRPPSSSERRPVQAIHPQVNISQAVQDVFGRAAFELGAVVFDELLDQNPILDNIYRQMQKRNRRAG